MSLAEDIAALRRELDALAATPDDALIRRYRLRRGEVPPTLSWQLRRLLGATFNLLRAWWMRDGSRWPVRLRHAAGRSDAKPWLIWAIGADRETLREACRGFAEVDALLPAHAPVLVTDVADFAFFSRLGWLVEFVPELDGEGEAYRTRKARMIARLYRGAPAMPVSAGLVALTRSEEVRRWITGQPSLQ